MRDLNHYYSTATQARNKLNKEQPVQLEETQGIRNENVRNIKQAARIPVKQKAYSRTITC